MILDSGQLDPKESTPVTDIISWLEQDLNLSWNAAQMVADRLNRGRGGRETSLCITKIEEALHRVGDIKHQLEIEAL